MSRRLVVDANRVFSAILEEGENRRAMMTTSATLFAPRFLRLEIERHKAEIVRRSRGKVEDVNAMIAVLYRRIAGVADKDVAKHMARARKLIGGIDPKDVPYLACALAVDADAIWSLDLDFDSQRTVPRTPHSDAPAEPRRSVFGHLLRRLGGPQRSRVARFGQAFAVLVRALRVARCPFWSSFCGAREGPEGRASPVLVKLLRCPEGPQKVGAHFTTTRRTAFSCASTDSGAIERGSWKASSKISIFVFTRSNSCDSSSMRPSFSSSSRRSRAARTPNAPAVQARDATRRPAVKTGASRGRIVVPARPTAAKETARVARRSVRIHWRLSCIEVTSLEIP